MPKCNVTRGCGASSPGESWNLDPLKSLETCLMLVVLYLQSFKGGQPTYIKRGTLPESLKRGGHVSPVPPVPTSMI